MKREYRHEDFEEFLKRSADNLRMKAPERVWENLSNHLNKERRRFSAGLSAFLLFIGLLGYLSISTSTKVRPTNQAFHSSQQTIAKNGTKQNSGDEKNVAILPTNNSSPGRRIERQQKNTTSPFTDLLFHSSTFTNRGVTAEAGELMTGNHFTPTVVDDDYEAGNRDEAEEKQPPKPAFFLSHDAAPWSIESVINKFTRKTSRFQTEFHFTPTISYRKLSENKSYLRTASLRNSPPNYAVLYGSVNNMVTHKPDLGFELGVTEKYSVTQKLRIRAGLQFNVNRYDIKAFNAPYSFAPIALRSRTSTRVDSVWALTNYSNVDASSNKSNWLQNFSFQVSAPVGVELALKGNEKMQFGIATTVQPTYVLGDRAYLITTDYKNYTQASWLLRRWNVNTAFQTFVSYQSGRTKWQVGPQVRYQLLSSFISNYPVKENLFDFGLKIGVSVNK